MALGLELLGGTLKLAAAWQKKGVNAQTAAKALLELAACAAVAAKVTDTTFREMAETALSVAKDLEQ